MIDAHTSLILEDKSTAPDVLEARLLGRHIPSGEQSPSRARVNRNGSYALSALRNTIAQGDCEELL